MLLCSNVLLLFGIAPVIAAQFVYAPSDLTSIKSYANTTVRYKKVTPGICEIDPTIKSFSGYVDISPGEHIFFWFFETRHGDPTQAPLTAWISGGPGSSSMRGLFQENGPCTIDSNGDVHSNPYSWSNKSNMLYIDQPVGVGFSYSSPIQGELGREINSTVAAAPRFWKTLQGFMGAFPQYSQKEFHLATESYGGHFGPVFSDFIATQNEKNLPRACKIYQKSLLIGNGWYSPLVQFQAHYNFTVSPGNTYDYAPFNESVASQLYLNLYGPGNCVDRLKDCKTRGDDETCRAADGFCVDEVESLYKIHLNRNEFDIRELESHHFLTSFYREYLNDPAVRSAVGVAKNYSGLSDSVIAAFEATGDDARDLDTLENVAELIKKDIRVTMYAGDADYNSNWLGGEAVAQQVGLKATAGGFAAAGYMNISTPDQLVHGQVKQSGGFSFVRVYDSGHEVPAYQPLASLAIFERTISGRDIATGRIPTYNCFRTPGPTRSIFRQGNSTIQGLSLAKDEDNL